MFRNSFFGVTLALAAILAMLSACGDSGTDSAADDEKNLVPVGLKTYDDLPNCTKKREGEEIFIEDENVTYMCSGEEWVKTKSKPAESFETFEDLPNCTRKRDGMEAFVEEENTSYVCHNEEWVEQNNIPGGYAGIIDVRDDSLGIIVIQGDTSVIWSDERKLPVFSLSSAHAADSGIIVSASSGGSSTSDSSSRRSSSSGAGYDDDDFIDDYSSNSNGSGSGTSSRQYASTSSSSTKTGTSGSIDMSVLNPSSSSVKVASSGNIVIDLVSSSSRIVITQSSVSQSSSSAVVVVPSSSSVAQHGGGSGETGTTCTVDQLKGSCKPTKDEEVKGRPVTYRFTPTSANSCNATDNIQWNVLPGLDGTTGGASPTSQNGGYTFDVTYSTVGEKKSVVFTMGGVNVPCDAVIIKSDCSTNNSYSCTVKLNSASNNLTKNNPVSYTWTLTKGGCHDVTSITWSGSVSASDVYTVTKDFTSAGTFTESVSVVDESSSTPKSVSCPSATVRNVAETAPTCSVASLTMPTDYAFAVKPSAVTGCDYDNNKCSYSLKRGSTVIASSNSGYGGGALPSISASSADTVGYTLTLGNYIGTGSCSFNVVYVTPVDTTATTTFISYTAGTVYRVSVGSELLGGFVCRAGTTNSARTVGTFNGTALTIPAYNSSSNRIKPSANSTNNIFIVADNVPGDLTCGLGW